MGGLCQGDPLPVNRMINRCKNITLPQTSFARGKNAGCKFVLVVIVIELFNSDVNDSSAKKSACLRRSPLSVCVHVFSIVSHVSSVILW